MAARAHGELIGVYVRSADGLRAPPSDALEEQRRLLDELGGEYRVLASADVAASLVQFAQAENATQIVLGASRQSRWTQLLRGSVINNVIRASGPIDVHVISSTGADASCRTDACAWHPSSHHRLAAPACARVGARNRRPAVLTLILAQLRDTLTLPSDLLMFMLVVVVVVAALGGFVPAFVCAISGFLFANWYFTPPFYEFTVEQGENLLALVVFLLVAGVVSMLVSTASRRRTAEAAQARAEAETLAALSGTLAAAADPLPQLVAQVQVAFDAEAVAVLAQGFGTEWVVVAQAGASPVRRRRTTADLSVPLYGDHMLVLRGSRSRSRGPRHPPGVRRPGGDRGAATHTACRRGAGRGPRGGERAAHRAARGRVARPAHAAVVDQGVGEQPACSATSTSLPARPVSCSRRSTTAPTGSTT